MSYEINQVYREINLSVRVSSHFWVIQSGIVHGQGVTIVGEHKFVVRFWAQTTRKETFLHFIRFLDNIITYVTKIVKQDRYFRTYLCTF